MAIDRTRTARGALAGLGAAAVWAAQQRLDMRVFGVRYDDTELLGKAVTRGPAWPLVGTAIHLANGAAFGAAYANLAPRMPLPAWAKDIDCANWAQFFLKWIVSHPAVTCAIPATANPAHMDENMGARAGRMPDAALRRNMLAHFTRA